MKNITRYITEAIITGNISIEDTSSAMQDEIGQLRTTSITRQGFTIDLFGRKTDQIDHHLRVLDNPEDAMEDIEYLTQLADSINTKYNLNIKYIDYGVGVVNDPESKLAAFYCDEESGMSIYSKAYICKEKGIWRISSRYRKPANITSDTPKIFIDTLASIVRSLYS